MYLMNAQVLCSQKRQFYETVFGVKQRLPSWLPRHVLIYLRSDNPRSCRTEGLEDLCGDDVILRGLCVSNTRKTSHCFHSLQRSTCIKSIFWATHVRLPDLKSHRAELGTICNANRSAGTRVLAAQRQKYTVVRSRIKPDA